MSLQTYISLILDHAKWYFDTKLIAFARIMDNHFEKKQDKLTAGDNIDITDDVISASVPALETATPLPPDRTAASVWQAGFYRLYNSTGLPSWLPFDEGDYYLRVEQPHQTLGQVARIVQTLYRYRKGTNGNFAMFHATTWTRVLGADNNFSSWLHENEARNFDVAEDLNNVTIPGSYRINTGVGTFTNIPSGLTGSMHLLVWGRNGNTTQIIIRLSNLASANSIWMRTGMLFAGDDDYTWSGWKRLDPDLSLYATTTALNNGLNQKQDTIRTMTQAQFNALSTAQRNGIIIITD